MRLFPGCCVNCTSGSVWLTDDKVERFHKPKRNITGKVMITPFSARLTYGGETRVESWAQRSVRSSGQDDCDCARQQRPQQPVWEVACRAISGNILHVSHAYRQRHMRLPVLDLIDPLHPLHMISALWHRYLYRYDLPMVQQSLD